MSHHKTGWNFLAQSTYKLQHVGQRVCMLSFITQSHVKYNIHIQEVQKRGYFVFRIACDMAKRKVNVPE